MNNTNQLSILKKFRKKLKFIAGSKCLNGIKELNIESDGRAIFCQMGTPESPSLTKKTVRDFNYDLKKFFDSSEAREKRLNCQGCPISCQQHIYFEPQADNIFMIIARIFLLPITVLLKSLKKSISH